MSHRVFHSHYLFNVFCWMLILISSPTRAQSAPIACHQVFHITSSAANNLLIGLSDYTLAASKVREKIIDEILESDYWQDRTRRMDLIKELKKVGEQEPSLRQKTDKLQILFSLPYYGVKEWSDILLRDLHPYDEKVLDYAKRLNANAKKKIVSRLGHAWFKNRDRAGIHVIHALLDPYSIYKTFISEGKSGLDFYEYYLEKVKVIAFPNEEIGGYTGKKVLEIAKILQTNLIGQIKNGVRIKAMNFFGSVVNGFARRASDLDVFNHPYEKDFPGMEDVELAQYRFQIEDAHVQKIIEETALQGTPFQWYLKSDGQIAHEHFGAMSHIFSIQITADNIQLRFYYKRPDIGEDNMTKWNYIDLYEVGQLNSF